MIKVTSWSNYPVKPPKDVGSLCRVKYFKKPGIRAILYVILQRFLEDYVEVERCNAGSTLNKKKGKVSRRQYQNSNQSTTH